MPVMETLKEKAGTLVGSVSEVNKLTIDKVEEATKLQLSAAGYYSDMAIRQMRALSSVKDMDSIRKFTTDSISLGGEMAKKMLDDGKSWMALGVDFKEKLSNSLSMGDAESKPRKAAPKAAAA